MHGLWLPLILGLASNSMISAHPTAADREPHLRPSVLMLTESPTRLSPVIDVSKLTPQWHGKIEGHGVTITPMVPAGGFRLDVAITF